MVVTRSRAGINRAEFSPKSLTFSETLRLAWFLIDAITHLTIELAYVWLALTTTAEKTDTYYGYIWREYARADSRWAIRDVNVISIEIATVFVGLLCIIQCLAIYNRWSIAHPLQLIICVAELYGGWMTFAPEWLDGSPSLDGSNFILLWIYLVFMNGLWVVLPLIFAWESFSVCSHATGALSPKVTAPGAPSSAVFFACMVLLIAYCILVPLVLLQADGVPVKE